MAYCGPLETSECVNCITLFNINDSFAEIHGGVRKQADESVD
jgi:hypothetical protein